MTLISKRNDPARPIAALAILAAMLTAGCRPAETSAGRFPLAVSCAAVAFADAEIERMRLAGAVASPDEASSAQMPRRRRVLYFTADWCVVCRGNEATLAALAARGWQIGPEETGHIQAVDVDQRPDLAIRYAITAVPAWILIDDGVECRRRHGVLDPFEVGRLFDE